MLHETEDLQEMVEAEACWEAVLRECRSFKYTKIGFRVQTIESNFLSIKKMLFLKRKFVVPSYRTCVAGSQGKL